MTTTVVLRCVIEHAEPLPPAKALANAVGDGGLMDVREIDQVNVSEVMRREGDLRGAEQSPLTEFMGNYFREKGRPHEGAKRELAAATAAICPQAETPGGPHDWSAGTNGLCTKCGVIKT